MKTHIQAWNSHRIPGSYGDTCIIIAIYDLFSLGRGIPNLVAQANNQAKQVHPSLIPTLDDAKISYESSGGNLSAASLFGTDPLCGHQELLQQRERFMEANNPSPEYIFGHVVNGSGTSFAQSLQLMIDFTNHLSSDL